MEILLNQLNRPLQLATSNNVTLRVQRKTQKLVSGHTHNSLINIPPWSVT